MPESDHTFTDRLREAINQQKEGGLRMFHRKLEERSEELVASGRDELVGTALSSVQKYASRKRKRDPTRRWVVEAAHVLGVRPEWLLTGEEPMRPATADADDAAAEAERASLGPVDPDAGAVQGRRWREDYREIVEDAFGTRVPALARAAIAHEWRRLHVLASGSPATRMEPEDLLRRLAEAVAAPAESLDVDLSRLREDELTDYIMDVVRTVAGVWELRLRQDVAEWIEESAEIQRG